MFELPYGNPVDQELDLSEGGILPFEHGAISTYLGRRNSPSGHRIVRAGRVVGWLAEPKKGKDLLCGAKAKQQLSELEQDSHRHKAVSWSQQALGAVAELVSEAFEHSADIRGLLGSGDSLERLLSRDLSAVLDHLSQRPEVRGAIAVDQGMLIDSAGDLPANADKLAIQVGQTLTGRKGMASDLGLEGAGHWTLHTGDGALLLAESGEVALAVWTEADVDHGRMINQISALMDGQVGAMGADGEKLYDGHI